jgi:accessory gene regulator protein AgrB
MKKVNSFKHLFINLKNLLLSWSEEYFQGTIWQAVVTLFSKIFSKNDSFGIEKKHLPLITKYKLQRVGNYQNL